MREKNEVVPWDTSAFGLRFVTGAKTGVVHVRVDLRPDDIDTSTRAMALYTATSKMRTACGIIIHTSNYHEITQFSDEQIYIRCHAAMGEGAIAIFSRPES